MFLAAHSSERIRQGVLTSLAIYLSQCRAAKFLFLVLTIDQNMQLKCREFVDFEGLLATRLCPLYCVHYG
jgi:hypothetical protein